MTPPPNAVEQVEVAGDAHAERMQRGHRRMVRPDRAGAVSRPGHRSHRRHAPPRWRCSRDRCRIRRSGGRSDRRNGRRARTEKRVEDDVVDVGVEADQAFGELDRERRRVVARARARSGRISHTSSVDARNSSLLMSIRAAGRASFASSDRVNDRTTLRRDHHPLGQVAQHGVRRLHVGAERARCRSRPSP